MDDDYVMVHGVVHPCHPRRELENIPTRAQSASGRKLLRSFFHSSDVLRVPLHAMTVQGRADAKEKFETIA